LRVHACRPARGTHLTGAIAGFAAASGLRDANTSIRGWCSPGELLRITPGHLTAHVKDGRPCKMGMRWRMLLRRCGQCDVYRRGVCLWVAGKESR